MDVDVAEKLPYRAEYAKSGRSNCKACKTSIEKDSLRLACMVQRFEQEAVRVEVILEDGFSQQQVARRIGFHYTTIRRVPLIDETGSYKEIWTRTSKSNDREMTDFYAYMFS